MQDPSEEVAIPRSLGAFLFHPLGVRFLVAGQSLSWSTRAPFPDWTQYTVCPRATFDMEDFNKTVFRVLIWLHRRRIREYPSPRHTLVFETHT